MADVKLAPLLCGLLIAHSASPCTILVVAYRGQVFAAGNEDEDDLPELSRHTVRFVPANKDKGALGYVAFGYANNPFSDESGMNEAGLFYDFDALPKQDTPRAGKPTGKFNAINEMLTKCRTVKEAVNSLESVDLPYLSSAQMVLGDATGASCIVDRSATTWRAREKNYQIGTNFRVSNTPVSEITCDRFKLCDAILTKKPALRIPTIINMLEQTKARKGSGSMTWYSVICDLKRKEVYLYLRGDFTRPTKFSLMKELKLGPRKLKMDEFMNAAKEKSSSSNL